MERRWITLLCGRRWRASLQTPPVSRATRIRCTWQKKSTRQPNEARARARLQALLREKLDADELARLLRRGRETQ